MTKTQTELPNDDQQYTRILKSTTIIGGSSAINVIFRVFQSKVVALLIGPSGVGMMGLLNSVLGLGSNIAGMGLSTSGVREIAIAHDTGDKIKISKTVTAFKWLTFFLGTTGALVLFLIRKPVSQLTFGNDQQELAIGLLSITLFITVISTAQSTLLRGMSHIRDLARINIFSVILGTLLGIPVIYIWKLDGVVAFIMSSAITSFAFSWFYSNKITIEKTRLTLSNFLSESRDLLAIGLGFMVSGLTTTGSTYIIKMIVTRRLGLDATGLFEASSQLANVYVGFILGAMGTDFFPHLSTVAHDKNKAAQLINAQVKIGLYTAAPGILAVFALGPLLINILYSNEFSGAYDILRWQAMGTFLRVISWPLGFLILSLGRAKIFLLMELSSNLVYLGSVWLCINYWGVQGLGIAFFIMYIYYSLITTIIAKNVKDFHWTSSNLNLSGLIFLFMLIAFANSFFLSKWWSLALGLVLTIGSGIFSIKRIKDLVGKETVDAFLLRIRNLLPFAKRK